MTQRFHGRTFSLLSDLELPRTLEGAILENCVFEACSFGQTADTPRDRRTIREVELVGCTSSGSTLGAAVVDSVRVEALKTHGVARIDGAAFRHVHFSGPCGKLLLNLPLPGPRRDSFRDATSDFYRSVDWAIDISKGEFAELDIRGIPAELIRRDPKTQVVARRDTIISKEHVWRSLDLGGAPWAGVLHNMLEWNLEDTVLVAPTRSKNFARWQAGLELLLQAGVLER